MNTENFMSKYLTIFICRYVRNLFKKYYKYSGVL